MLNTVRKSQPLVVFALEVKLIECFPDGVVPMNRNPKFSRIPVLVVSGLLTVTGCSSPTTEVTDNEALAFSQQAQGSSTYLARFKNQDDWKDLASAVCDSFAGGQSYKNVSETVGA